MNLQAPELLIILVVVLLLFGGAKLPKLARSLGQAQKEFKDGLRESDASGPTSDGGSAEPGPGSGTESPESPADGTPEGPGRP